MDNLKTLIIDNQYFISVELLKTLVEFSNVKIEQCDTWQKMSFRNRCMVVGANGVMGLTVPIQKGRDQKAFFRDIKIDYSSGWQLTHWRTLVTNYNRSPFFEYYAPSLKEIIFTPYSSLFELNLATLHWVLKSLKLAVNLSFTETFLPQYPNFVKDDRNRYNPKNFQQIQNPVRYTQVFETKIGFQKNLSCIDLLCCEGPNALHILLQKL